MPKSTTPIVKEELKVTGDPKAFYKKIVEDNIRADKYDLEDFADLSYLQFEAE